MGAVSRVGMVAPFAMLETVQLYLGPLSLDPAAALNSFGPPNQKHHMVIVAMT